MNVMKKKVLSRKLKSIARKKKVSIVALFVVTKDGRHIIVLKGISREVFVDLKVTH